MKEAWSVHAGDWNEVGISRVQTLFHSAGLHPADDYLSRWPSQISAGQAQRVLIAMALLHEPAVIIADEPTSALDLLTQREILRLLSTLSTGHRTGMLFISHDIPAVAGFCDKVAILHEGTIVEAGAPAEVLKRPAHAYTRALVDAVPEWCRHS
jgi:ABC-type dipeptide/oligopeptide/nickel transport system ATPase component